MQTSRSIAIARTLFNHLAALAVATAALLASASAWADPPGRVGRIAEAHGTVWVFDAEQGEWIAARRNRPLTGGDRLSAERGARVELQIGSTTLRLDGDSELEVSTLDDANVRLQLHNGSLALRLRDSQSAREFSVTTREGRFEPQRVGHYRIDQEDNASFGGVIAGAMRFESRDSALEVNAGQRAEFWSERGVTHYSWSALPNDRFADWVAQQDRQDERDARRRPYVSPEMTGADDLDRYGDWSQHPEYGAIWMPTRVEPGWAPYRYGQWTYVQPWGWTWVDNAPWGFAPFHYGRWVSWQGRWVWAPGQYVARPVYAPALVAWIGGPHLSIGINIGGPSVGWVPLSPREVYVPAYRVTNIYVTNVNSPYRRWHPPIRPDQPVRTGPIMYTNQGVPGGVTVVSQQVLRERQPISSAVIAPVDARTISRWQTQPLQQGAQGDDRRGHNMAPPAPTASVSRLISTPGGAVPVAPAAPGAVRSTPWGQVAPAPRAAVPAAPAARGNSGDVSRGRPPLADSRGEPAPAAERAVIAPAGNEATRREAQERRHPEQDNGRGNQRRIAPAPVAQPVPPSSPAAAAVQVAPQSGPGAPVAQPPVKSVRGAPPREEPAGTRGRSPKDEDRDERQAPGQERRRDRQPQN